MNPTTGIDTETLKAEADRKKFVHMGYVTEYPDVTVLYVNHEYTKTNSYLMVRDNGLTKEAVKKLNAALKPHGLRVYLEEVGSSSSITAKLIAQPLGYTVS